MELAVGLVCLALLLLWLSWRLRKSSGLPDGRIAYSDSGAWRRNERALSSQAHGLTGKPDYLLQEGDALIPVELKSGPAPRDGKPREGHVLQALAYCLLVQAEHGARPSHALIKYDDRSFEVAFSASAEAELLRVLQQMHAQGEDEAHRSHASAARCSACGVRSRCDEIMT